MQDKIVGLGHQIIEIDLSASDRDILDNLQYARAVVFNDDLAEKEGRYEARGPFSNVETDSDRPQAFYRSVDGSVFADVQYILRFVHKFEHRGNYRIAVSLTANDLTTWSRNAVLIGVSDGLDTKEYF